MSPRQCFRKRVLHMRIVQPTKHTQGNEHTRDVLIDGLTYSFDGTRPCAAHAGRARIPRTTPLQVTASRGRYPDLH